MIGLLFWTRGGPSAEGGGDYYGKTETLGVSVTKQHGGFSIITSLNGGAFPQPQTHRLHFLNTPTDQPIYPPPTWLKNLDPTQPRKVGHTIRQQIWTRTNLLPGVMCSIQTKITKPITKPSVTKKKLSSSLVQSFSFATNSTFWSSNNTEGQQEGW